MSIVETFRQMNLDQRLLQAIVDLNWSKPTDVQQAVIPLMLEKKCILVQAKTGSGKTAAFAVPIINELLTEKQLQREQCVSVIVLTPTKELCNQAIKSIKSLCKYCSKDITCLDIAQQTDVSLLKPLLAECPDIVVSTPARIIAHLRAGNLSLKKLKRIAVDEADLIFTFGHQKDMVSLKEFLPNHPLQIILLSATLDDSTKTMRRCLVKGGDWVRVELPDEAFLPSDAQLTQYIISAEEQDKYTILVALLKLRLVRGKTLIFTNSVDRCFKLRLFLEAFGIRVALLNSELPVLSRSHAIDQFNRGLYDYLIATDESQTTSDNAKLTKKRRDNEYGVCRGIDFQLVSNVLNFDFPSTPSLYVHRVGRTARADQMGTALSFVNTKEAKCLAEVEALFKPGGDQSTSVPGGSTFTFRPYQFRLSEVDGFRYRASQIVNQLTRKVIREARLKEIKNELLNSEKLKGYFEDHVPDLQALRHDRQLNKKVEHHLGNVPDYLVPPALRELMDGPHNRKRKRQRRQNTSQGNSTQHAKRHSSSNPQFKRQLSKKRRAQDPLFNVGRKRMNTN